MAVIMDAERTGKIGDGEIFVEPIKQAFKICTEKSGNKVL